MRIEKPTFGSDIEFFLKTARGEFFPAIGLVKGTKQEPRPLGDGYFIQEDNVAVEFNIPVCNSVRDFTRAVSNGLMKCCNELPPTVTYTTEASAEFHDEYLMSPQAREFGCEPDMCAWTRDFNPRPQSPNHRLRSAGGHFHIGWNNPDMDTRFELIKACDVFVGIPSLSEDIDKRRRELYGKAGAMRIKPYGVEHRLLSNYWMFMPELTSAIATRYSQAIDFINYGHEIEKTDYEAIVHSINNSNATMGNKILKKYKTLLTVSDYKRERV